MLTLGALAILATAVLISLFSKASATFQQSCNTLVNTLSVPNATIYLTTYVSAGTNLTFPTLPATCGAKYQVVSDDICRIALNVSTSSRSHVMMEAWLPANWTGRFLSTGNGGINGCPAYSDMAYAASFGFAATGSNNGHDGQSGVLFLNNPDVVTDFAWRALHTSVTVGKQITQSFYQKPYSKSYYLGCSTGGRQGFHTAQNHPSDFDGIVAGAPAFDFNNLTSWSGIFYPIIHSAGPNGFPPNATWSAIDAEILAQCDGIDGLEDGVIEDPLLCSFRPESLICPSTNANTSACITGVQAETIRKVFSPLYGVNGDFVFPALQYGPTLLASVYTFYAQMQFLYTNDWFKYAVYNDPNLDTSVITPEMAAFAWNKNAGDINTWSGDLGAFKNLGGKLLHYHGQQDQIITSSNSPLYYDYVSRTMNLPDTELDDFYR